MKEREREQPYEIKENKIISFNNNNNNIDSIHFNF